MKLVIVLLLVSTFLVTIIYTIPVQRIRFNKNFFETKHRLSGNVKPSFYSIKLHPDIDRETFEGEVFIRVQSYFSVDHFEFHSKNLNIHSIHFNSKEVHYISTQCPCNMAENVLLFEFVDYDIIRIQYGKQQQIPPGSHIIQIKYDGLFSKTTEGMFKTSFSKNGTILSEVIATDFEPSLARQVFPCFDEPSFKAKFQLSVVVPNDSFTALSNMRVSNKYNTLHGVVYRFEVTPPMSTYLLSFVISQHSCSEYFDVIPFRVCSFNGSNENTIRFLEFSSKVIQFYENYTNFKYNLPKLDFVGFDRKESAATENWGLVTFNSSLLSPDNDIYDDSQKYTVIAHELAHSWFGNLVTNDWWDSIWLQEAFATFMSIKAEDLVLNNSASDQFLQLYMDNLFWVEREKNSTPVVNYEFDTQKIRNNFNDITYNKGAAILRMLETVTGEENLQKIIIEYVHKFAYKSASTNDFLDIIDNFIDNINIREFMESYLYQSYYPILHVYEVNDTFYFEQHHCCHREKIDSSFGFKWTIPITYITHLEDTPKIVWFYKDMDKLILPKNNATWIKINYRQIGYYRVNYSTNLWELLIQHNRELERYERDSLLVEAADLFESDLISCDIVLKYIFQLASNITEDDPFNFENSFIMYTKLSDKIKTIDEDAYKNLKNFFTEILNLTRKKRYVRFFTENYNILAAGRIGKTNRQNEQITQTMYSCVKWLKFESQNYLNNHVAFYDYY